MRVKDGLLAHSANDGSSSKSHMMLDPFRLSGTWRSTLISSKEEADFDNLIGLFARRSSLFELKMLCGLRLGVEHISKFLEFDMSLRGGRDIDFFGDLHASISILDNVLMELIDCDLLGLTLPVTTSEKSIIPHL